MNCTYASPGTPYHPFRRTADLSGFRVGILHKLVGLKVCILKRESILHGLPSCQKAGAEILRDITVHAEAHQPPDLTPKGIILITDLHVVTNKCLSTLTTNPNNMKCLEDLSMSRKPVRKTLYTYRYVFK